MSAGTGGFFLTGHDSETIMQIMKAFHAFWTAPRRRRGDGGELMRDHELLTLMLSALKWRENCGEIVMVTDSAGREYFERAGLGSLWSEDIDASLDLIPPDIDPLRFWAAGKLEALRRVSAPCVMLDTDLIVWEDLGGRLGDCAVAAHFEPVGGEVYPDPGSVFTLDPDYAFPQEWDFGLDAVNTAFLYIPDDGLRLYYTDEAFRFMRALREESGGPTVTMCFAEQRLFPMCAAAKGVGLRTLIDPAEAYTQSLVTHLWGAKRAFEGSPERRVEYCLGCAMRILKDHPEWEGVLRTNPQTVRYIV